MLLQVPGIVQTGNVWEP